MGGVIGLVIFGALVIFIIIIGRKGQKKENAEIQTFAQSNGYTFEAKPQKETTIDLAIFSREHSLTIRDLVTMPSGRRILECYVADATGTRGHETSAGGNADTPFLTCIIPLTGSNVVFDLLPKVMSGRFGWNTQGLQPYQLEGSLNQIYDLFIQPGNEVETLSLLQSDTLLQLAQNSPESPVIGRPGYLYFFYRNSATPNIPQDQMPKTGIHLMPNVSYAQQFQTLNTLADMVLKNLRSQTLPQTQPLQVSNNPNIISPN